MNGEILMIKFWIILKKEKEKFTKIDKTKIEK